LYKKAKIVVYSFLTLTIALTLELAYLDATKSLSQKQIKLKQDFVSLTQLPDLAISTEATYIRHRSLATTFDIYKDDGVLREYFVSSFVIMNSKVSNE
jgi:hypothetical protein